MGEYRLESQSIQPNFGLDQRQMQESGDVLSKLIADQWVISNKAFHCKHNVLGKRREMLKDLFQVCTKNFILSTELTGKELRNLGFRVPHLPEMLNLTRINPSSREKWPDSDTMVNIILQDVERIIQVVSSDVKRIQNIKVPDVEDFLAETVRNHKEIAKKLRCHMETKGGRPSSMYGGPQREEYGGPGKWGQREEYGGPGKWGQREEYGGPGKWGQREEYGGRYGRESEYGGRGEGRWGRESQYGGPQRESQYGGPQRESQYGGPQRESQYGGGRYGQW